MIGSGGAGKSTFARQLGEILKIKVIHLDALYWNPGWVKTPSEEWEKKQESLVKEESWIIDGNFSSSLDIRMEEADTIIFLDFPRTLCLYRAIKRRIKYIGKSRPDMGKGCPEHIDIEFLKWIWQFPVKTKPRIMDKIKKHSDGKNVYILKSPSEIKTFLQNL